MESIMARKWENP